MKTYKFQIILIVVGFSILLLSFISNKKNKVVSKNWININYAKCIEKKLPCECEEITKTYFAMTLDTNKISKSFGVSFLKYDENEFYQFNLKKVFSNKFKVFRMGKDSINTLGYLVLKKDTVYFFDIENNKSIFINYGSSLISDDYQYLKQNISLLNKAFISRKYQPLENILNQDSLNCACNKELGKVNLISVDKSSKSWILEQSEDSVYIYSFLNSSDDRSYPPKIVKQIFKSYKW